MEVKIKSNFGPVGLADVRILKNKVKIIFEDGDIYELPKEAWREELEPGNYTVGLSRDRSKIMFVKPPGNMSHMVVFKEFKRGFGSDIPEPRLEPASSKVINGKLIHFEEEWRFKAVLKIYDPEGGLYDGLELTMPLPYIFENNGVGQALMAGSRGQTSRLEKFLRAAGWSNDDIIPYSPNVLPGLELKLQELGYVFQVNTNEKGFVTDTITVVQSLVPKRQK